MEEDKLFRSEKQDQHLVTDKETFIRSYLVWVKGMLERHLEPKNNELSYIVHASKILVGHIKTVEEMIND